MRTLCLDLGKIVLLALLLAAAHWTQRFLWRPSAPPNLSVTALLQSRDEYELVDARSAEEFTAGHIPGAVNLSVSQAMRLRRDGKVLLARGRGKPVLVYCDGADCNASTKVGLWLQEQGYQVFVLSEGYPGWSAAQEKKP